MCVVPQWGSQHICQTVTAHEIVRTARKQTGSLTGTGDQASLQAEVFASELNCCEVTTLHTAESEQREFKKE